MVSINRRRRRGLWPSPQRLTSKLGRGASLLLTLWVTAGGGLSLEGGALGAQEAQAQAFCALRQPHRAQQRLFPESTSLETFTDSVTQEHRDEVKKELTFTIHEAELGMHTLYAVFTGEGSEKKHTGYIHMRSEEGEWGLIEIAWALTPDLKVKDFFFQRCRESGRNEILGAPFKMFIKKKTLAELRPALNTDGSALSAPIEGISDETQPLAYRLVRSAIKTIAVTRAVWYPVIVRKD